ncbi:hypothetical protein D3C71_531590 [compost metagenome]
MSLAIISLAPSYPAKARHAIKARWPEIDLDSVPIVTFYGYSWDGRLFDIPRHIAWNELPARRPVTRMKSHFIGFRTGILGPHSNDNTVEMLRPILMQKDEILLLCDDDVEAIGAANDFLCDVFGSIPKGRIVYPMGLFDWARDRDTDATRMMTGAGYFEDVAGEVISASEISDYFDYNYVLNATPILGFAARSAGLKGVAPSAFGLQLLYWMSEQETAVTPFGLRNDVMRDWRGLGKYADGKGMGSMRSRQAIVERLAAGGYLAKCRDGATDLTVAGRNFLSILHKDCRDPDLPFRIRKWGTLPAKEARSKVDGYIKAFFGKQARTTDRSGMARAAG